MNKCSRCHTLFEGEDVIFLGPYTLCPRCRKGFDRFMEGAPDTDMQNEMLQNLYDKEQQRCRELEVSLNNSRNFNDTLRNLLEAETTKNREIEEHLRIAEKANDMHYDQFVHYYWMHDAESKKLTEIKRHIAEIYTILRREPDADPDRVKMGKELGV